MKSTVHIFILIIVLLFSQTNICFASDNFPGTTIAGTSGNTSAANTGSTGESGEPLPPNGSPLNTYWYSWTAPSNGTATFSTCSATNTTFDTIIAGYTGSAVNALTNIATNDDDCANTFGSLASRITFSVTSGTTYYVQIDGYGSDTGNFQLNWSHVASAPGAGSCTGTAYSASTATLSFADAGVNWPTNVYLPQTYTNIDGQGVQATLSFSDTSTFNSAQETNTNTGNGDTAPFFITNGFGAGSTIFTFDISANPANFVELCAYHINQSGGGDNITFRAVTDLGTILTNPTFFPAASPTYTLSGNNADAFSFTTIPNGLLGVNFQAPSGEYIDRIELTWSESSGSSGGIHGLGIGEFSFDVLTNDYSDAPTAGYGGADHIISSGIRLGSTVTAESADYNDPNATGDSDDGVTLPTFIQDMPTTVSVDVAGAGGYLQAWIDWDGNNSFAGAGENIAVNVQDGGVGDADSTSNGIIELAVTVPAAAITTQTFSRFRWSTTSSLGASGSATDGEVEDYALTVVAGAPSLSVTKTASAPGFTTGDIQEAPAGTNITYTYVITNNGNQTISDLSLTDIHGGSGPPPVPDVESAVLTDNGTSGDSTNPVVGDGLWQTLAPGDVLTTTAGYTVTQNDVDTLQ